MLWASPTLILLHNNNNLQVAMLRHTNLSPVFSALARVSSADSKTVKIINIGQEMAKLLLGDQQTIS